MFIRRIFQKKILIQTKFYFSQDEKFNTSEFIDIGSPLFKKGTLTVCPTPIGNLQDMSIRQYKALVDAHVLACEDTRYTGKLLQIMKQKNIKDVFNQKFNVELTELKSDEQEDFDDTEVIDVIDSVDSLDQNVDLKTPQQKLLEKIREIREKSRKILIENQSLNIYHEKLEEEKFYEQDSGYFGLEDEFIKYLKLKIQLSKKRKGRGVLISYHKYNEGLRTERIIKMLTYGLNVTLVSDAGTPTISDPGFILVDKCIQQEIQVQGLPGPCAIPMALSVSGFPSDTFKFGGFLSKNQAQKESTLERLRDAKTTAVLFENVSRLPKTLLSIDKIYGSKQIIFMAVEMTKMYERHFRKTVREIYDLITDPELDKDKQKYKGEITLVLPPHQSLYNADIKEQQAQEPPHKHYYKEWVENMYPDISDKKALKQFLNIDQEGQEIKPQDKFEFEEKHDFNVNAKSLISILDDKLEVSNQELADLVKDILKISKNRANNLVQHMRYKRKVKKDWDELYENPAKILKRVKENDKNNSSKK